ncbi:ABC transporter ATP-binding protein [Roseiconus nitratireducens]|uniref:ABC transporter ATP-binding protein n=1 Tax=Roseiconus nitratireducens TaxID=2605748 RepID=UPI0036F339D6
MPSPIVDVDQLRKTYRSLSLSGRRTVEAVRGVSLQARAGEVFGLLGPNGAGKTTLIKMLLGVVKPSGGSASLFGQPIGSVAARTRVGYLPESLRVDRHHTARSALRYYGRMSRMNGSQIRARSEELLRLVGLLGRDRESVRRFSKGMYQRLGLAQALMHDPDLLVLDEPTDGLDPVGRNEVRKVIEQLRDAGKTIFLNSHILQEVEMVCTRVAILAEGQIRAIGPIGELAHGEDPRVVVEIPIAKTVDDRDSAPGSPASEPSWSEVFGAEKSDTIHSKRLGAAFQLTIPAADQNEINWIVDQLRQANHSISRLQVHRETLEETFIRLVGDSKGLVS